MTNGIIVPLDGSSLARQAVPFAAHLATRCHTELLLAHAVVATPHGGETGAQAIARDRAEAEASLTALRADLVAPGLTVDVAVEEGDPTAVVLSLARERQGALIVMTTHGRSGPARWVLGSIAEQVLQRTHLPVLLLTPWALEQATPASLDRRVLVPLDGSALSERIRPVVRALTRRARIPVTLVRALDLASLHVPPVATLQPDSADLTTTFRRRVAEEASAWLEEAAWQWRVAGIEVDAMVRTGTADEVIPACAAERQAGWLAMASHGRGLWGTLLGGRTAMAMLTRTSLPLLVVASPHLDGYTLGECAG